ncbi:MAG: hypothetical protein KDE48_13825 [Anaerolineales bacterium]|nr:hypothetical protein [Anaerolineales bacterium]MCA9975828.1 hypothetical protein [Anaerolineales bacterium]
MIIINFTHPLTPDQQSTIEDLTGQTITAVYTIPCQVDNNQPFAPQVADLINAVNLTATAWQTQPILINPPAYAPVTAVLLAALHGRMGYFPAIVRIRPQSNSVPPQYEVAEIINLQSVRDNARSQRT